MEWARVPPRTARPHTSTQMQAPLQQMPQTFTQVPQGHPQQQHLQHSQQHFQQTFTQPQIQGQGPPADISVKADQF